MHARDASGRQVSLLNDGAQAQPQAQPQAQRPLPTRPFSYTTSAVLQGQGPVLPRPSPSLRSNSSSPNMPELLRSDSYDSQASNDPISPMTPSVEYAFPRTSSVSGASATAAPPLYPVAQDYATVDAPPAKRPAYLTESRNSSYDEDAVAARLSPSAAAVAAAGAPLAERPGKRYPCRYRESHGCDKTFTTSGHASRHSKIHTAEKAVQCTYPGCQKKFTRADNMKQHLETHYKDKGRPAAAQRAGKASSLAGARRHSTSGRSRSAAREMAAAAAVAAHVHAGTPPPTATTPTLAAGPWKAPAPVEQYPLPAPGSLPLPPVAAAADGAAWDMRGLNLPLLNRPAAAAAPRPPHHPSSGLDALAMAIACQENKA